MTAGSGDLDWHSLAAFVSHYAPGSTDPMELVGGSTACDCARNWFAARAQRRGTIAEHA